MTTVIKVENLGKKYLIRHQQRERYTALRDVLTNKAGLLARKIIHPMSHELSAMSSTREEFWALKDLSFEVMQGDRVGIIGRNGAGKTTLLKLLSRITEPTSGRISIKGRVASLLEVGTGFHPELTGRENIFLNGAILGMTKAEIKKKFDEIVAFAEVEKFLDTPIKRYSSGMYVRLAFGVAAHLEPEILLVDEVLAVGDAGFQKKCLGKMREVGDLGRTILFVSHNMSAIQTLCPRCLVLEDGHLFIDESSNKAVRIYLTEASSGDSFARPKRENGYPTLVSGKIVPDNKGDSYLQIMVNIFSSMYARLSLDVRLHDVTGNPVGFGSLGALNSNHLIEVNPDVTTISFKIPIDNLAVGKYFIGLDLTVPNFEYYDRAENCLSFEVARPPKEGGGRALNQCWGYGCWELPIIMK